MNRTRFYEIETVNGIQEFDYLHHSLSRFQMKYEPSYYRVGHGDLLRPDLISYRFYGTVKYWWLICYVNGIYDVFIDLKVGQLLKIPNILDIYDFYRNYKKR